MSRRSRNGRGSNSRRTTAPASPELNHSQDCHDVTWEKSPERIVEFQKDEEDESDVFGVPETKRPRTRTQSKKKTGSSTTKPSERFLALMDSMETFDTEVVVANTVVENQGNMVTPSSEEFSANYVFDDEPRWSDQSVSSSGRSSCPISSTVQEPETVDNNTKTSVFAPSIPTLSSFSSSAKNLTAHKTSNTTGMANFYQINKIYAKSDNVGRIPFTFPCFFPFQSSVRQI